MSDSLQRVGVVGGGAWGTALATLLCQGGRDVVLWARDPDVVAQINAEHRNQPFLPEIALHQGLHATGELAEAAQADLLLLASPAQHLRAVTARLTACVPPGLPVMICAKGIERETLRFMTEVLAETLPECAVAVLSGPTFAHEVARGLPTAVTVACADERLGQRLLECIGQPAFRPYLSDDLVGVQVGGALKNVVAIACGIVEGRGLGDNARAALMTRGLAEMLRFGRAKGARTETLMGLSGLGDLTLTCNSDLSRNTSLGIELGEGRTAAEILDGRRSVAEGASTVSAVVDAANRLEIDMPIAVAVEGVVNFHADIEATISGLLARPFKAETA